MAPRANKASARVTEVPSSPATTDGRGVVGVTDGPSSRASRFAALKAAVRATEVTSLFMRTSSAQSPDASASLARLGKQGTAIGEQIRDARRMTATTTNSTHLSNVAKIAPKVQERMRQKALHARLQVLLAEEPQMMEIAQSLMLPKEERTMSQLTDLRNLMRSTAMLREVADDSIQQLEICRCMSLELFNAKDRIIKEGEVGDRAYVLMRGTIGIYKGRKTKAGHPPLALKGQTSDSDKLMDNLKPVCSFGEIALKSDVPRNATCVANEDGVICATIPRALYRRYVQSGERRSVFRFYKDQFPRTFPDQDIISLSFSSDVKTAHRGAVLTQAGKSGSRFFFLMQGLCHIVDHNHEQHLEAAQRLPSAPSTDCPSAEGSNVLAKRNVSAEEDNDKGENTWFGAAAPWMWDARHIWTAIRSGDYFGLEAAVSDGIYLNTIVAATECQIIVLPTSCWPGAFPKAVREDLESSLLQTIDWRKAREHATAQRPRSVLDFDSQQRALGLREKSGRATKFVPKRPEMTYTPWKAPEREIFREAEIEESPELALLRQTVSLPTRSRQFQMASSVCLQMSPLDLLRPPKAGPQMIASVGFLHKGPKQRGPPGAAHLPSIRKNASMPRLGKESSMK